MILLDTNHLSALQRGNELAQRLLERLKASDNWQIYAPIISVEEQFRGWLNATRKYQGKDQELYAHAAIADLLTFYAEFLIAEFSQKEAAIFKELRKNFRRTGTMDLKIAAIGISNNALLLTENLKDFEEIPNLKCENWLQS